jgi:hypothetical protein
METDRLITHLVECADPVKPLPFPWTRAMAWLVLSAPYIALVVLVVSPRTDLIAKLADWRFLLEQMAALATAVTAATAAFATVIPGYSRSAILFPALPLAIWLGSLSLGSIQTWLRYGAAGLTPELEWICFPAIALAGSVPAIALAVMLRRGVPLMPCVTTGLGGLAAAGLGDFGLRLFHQQDASLMVLVWQVGSVAILTGIAACSGRYILNWESLTGTTRRTLAIG